MSIGRSILRWAIRWVALVIVLMPLGAATSYAVTYALVCTIDANSFQNLHREMLHPLGYLRRQSNALWSQTSLEWALLAHRPPDPVTDSEWKARAYELWRLSAASHHPQGESLPSTDVIGLQDWGFFEAGWPVSSQWGWAMRDAGTTSPFREGGLYVERGAGWGPLTVHVAFPYLPYWPGLITNAAFYASLWTVPLMSAVWLVRRARNAIRRRRGLCPKCAYDRRGLPADALCPECGKGV